MRRTGELAAHQISEIVPAKGVTLVGPLPKELQRVTTYSAGVAAKTTAPELARGFVAFLTRPAFAPKFAEVGLDLPVRAHLDENSMVLVGGVTTSLDSHFVWSRSGRAP